MDLAALAGLRGVSSAAPLALLACPSELPGCQSSSPDSALPERPAEGETGLLANGRRPKRPGSVPNGGTCGGGSARARALAGALELCATDSAPPCACGTGAVSAFMLAAQRLTGSGVPVVARAALHVGQPTQACQRPEPYKCCGSAKPCTATAARSWAPRTAASTGGACGAAGVISAARSAQGCTAARARDAGAGPSGLRLCGAAGRAGRHSSASARVELAGQDRGLDRGKPAAARDTGGLAADDAAVDGRRPCSREPCSLSMGCMVGGALALNPSPDPGSLPRSRSLAQAPQAAARLAADWHHAASTHGLAALLAEGAALTENLESDSLNPGSSAGAAAARSGGLRHANGWQSGQADMACARDWRVLVAGALLLAGSVACALSLLACTLGVKLAPLGRGGGSRDVQVTWWAAAADDRYYCLLLPLTLPVFLAAVTLNWLCFKLFKHNW